MSRRTIRKRRAAADKSWLLVLFLGAVMAGLCLGIFFRIIAGSILEARAQGNTEEVSEAALRETEDWQLVLDNTELPDITENNTQPVGASGEEQDVSEEEEENSDIAEEKEDTELSGDDEEEKESFDRTKEVTIPDVEYPYYIKVNRLANCVTVYTMDEDGEYSVPVKAMVCSVGLNDNTPLGVFHTSDKYDWRYLFGDVYGQYAYRIHGSIMFHSVPYYTANKDDLETGEYNKLGEAASLGCVRLSCADAKWLVDNCPKGTTVEIYDSEDPGPMGKPEAIRIDTASENAGWDPTDPDTLNPWKQTDGEEQSGTKDAFNNQENADAEEDVLTDYEQSGQEDLADEVIRQDQTIKDTTPPQITVPDSITITTEEEDSLREQIISNIEAEDEQEFWIYLDYVDLSNAVKKHQFGTYRCSVYAMDVFGNKSSTVEFDVIYAPGYG